MKAPRKHSALKPRFSWHSILYGSVLFSTASLAIAQEPPKPPDQPKPQGATQELPRSDVVASRPQNTTGTEQSVGQGNADTPGFNSSTFGPPGEGVGGRGADLFGISPSASRGTISHENLEYRPLFRAPDVLQTIPGMMTTVSAGGLRPNYFLRGFDLRFGTDFATFVDGVPLNMPAHVHAQGYTDLNFLIPETVKSIDYGKGPYYAEVGDFSSAGFASINTFSLFPNGFVKAELGRFNYWRTVVGDSAYVGRGVLLYAFETQGTDGPWDVPEHLRQFKGFLKYTVSNCTGGYSLGFSAYTSNFTSQEPIPQRAVDMGLISRFGSLDPTDGGNVTRYSLNGQIWHRWNDDSVTKANAYVTYYTFNSWENETFFLDDPVLGDQINERDRRWTTGFNIAHEMPGELFGLKTKNTVGLQLRQDWIPVNNHDGTSQRQLVDPLSENKISQFSTGVFYKNELQWAEKLRTVAGVRGDFYSFNVDSKVTPENSGNTTAGVCSPKASVILGPWADTEFYLNGGMSYHSNDAKGVFTVTDPATGEPLTPVPGLIQSRGAEVGLRSKLFPNLTSTLAVWQMHLDSELIFRGDEGTTEPLPASERQGVELTNYYQVCDWLTAFADFSHSRARFAEFNPAGQYVPGAPETVVGGGLTAKACSGLYMTWNVQYFGPRALIEDNSARSSSTTVVNLETGWESSRFRLAIGFFNLLNSHDHDIDYFFTSRLTGEPLSGVADNHFRPLEPFAIRVSATYKW